MTFLDSFQAAYKEENMQELFAEFTSVVEKINRIYEKHNQLGKTRGFEYLREDFKTLPYRGTRKSAGYDFFAPCSFELKPGESVVIATNITAYMLPDEYLAIYPRSGHGFKFFARLANTVGIIDSDFYGNEIKVKIRNESADALLKIEKDQAFCQGIFQNYLLADGDSFTEGAQRAGGFGSTDKRIM